MDREIQPRKLGHFLRSAGISRGHGSADGGRGQPTLRNCLGTRGQQRFQGGAALGSLGIEVIEAATKRWLNWI